MRNSINGIPTGTNYTVAFGNVDGQYVVELRKESRVPVIVLTANELFAPHSLCEVWGKLGGKHDELANVWGIRTENLRMLADLTQQLYLQLPPDSAWLRVKWENGNARRLISFPTELIDKKIVHHLHE
ncbi:hypothetical protein [Janthinobacterium sp. PAMC25594]|uniref:hypothetical protein n=1 Tax=Janthinobacterium sp. PAMC25594 TaxID=2861284 RepID=UPI001C62AAC5|nr:hypothetical protein [Janthinobacterium sp. PAMC25594]QYG08872.1 hypothetical protein KY494_09050 [Janthinobacterium sp. PAMC25594]